MAIPLPSLPAIPQFEAQSDPSSLGPRWTAWRERLDFYIAAAGIKDDGQKRATLLHLAGESVQKVFKGLPDPKGTFEQAAKALDDHFQPKKDPRFERHIFRRAAQGPTESIDQYVARLRTLALTCDFPDSDEAIADQLVDKCRSTRLKKKGTD